MWWGELEGLKGGAAYRAARVCNRRALVRMGAMRRTIATIHEAMFNIGTDSWEMACVIWGISEPWHDESTTLK